MTNFEVFKAMNEDQLASFLETNANCKCCVYAHRRACPERCKNGILKFLSAEAPSMEGEESEGFVLSKYLSGGDEGSAN